MKKTILTKKIFHIEDNAIYYLIKDKTGKEYMEKVSLIKKVKK